MEPGIACSKSENNQIKKLGIKPWVKYEGLWIRQQHSINAYFLMLISKYDMLTFGESE